MEEAKEEAQLSEQLLEMRQPQTQEVVAEEEILLEVDQALAEAEL